MKITDVKLLTLELPEEQPTSEWKLVQVPNLQRIQYTHTRQKMEGTQKQRANFLKVTTDEGIDSVMTTDSGIGYAQIPILRSQVVGESVFHREALWQKLHKGTRWVYQCPGWFGDFDNCLWDIIGKAAGLPVHALVGRVRDRLPVYLTGGDATTEQYLEAIEFGKTLGINAYKFHTYKGGKADIPIFNAVREAVGPEYDLINDPVCSYNLREAIEVGQVMEDLDFVWLEEPIHEFKLNLYQELCEVLTIPVMGNETLMNDIGISSQWLIQGGTDLLRGNARSGTTNVLKMAHLAEMYSTTIELNGMGGLFGLVHATLGCCIDNTTFYEFSGTSGARCAVRAYERAVDRGGSHYPERPAGLGGRVGRGEIQRPDTGGAIAPAERVARRAGEPEDRRARKPEGRKVGKPESQKTRKPESQKAGRPESQKTRKPEDGRLVPSFAVYHAIVSLRRSDGG